MPSETTLLYIISKIGFGYALFLALPRRIVSKSSNREGRQSTAEEFRAYKRSHRSCLFLRRQVAQQGLNVNWKHYFLLFIYES